MTILMTKNPSLQSHEYKFVHFAVVYCKIIFKEMEILCNQIITFAVLMHENESE